jgi:prevent-host-death family protein
MKTIKASEFKAKCLQLMDDIAKTGEEVVVTKRGKPVVRVSPVKQKPASLYGALKGHIKITGDILEPVDERWEANR